MRGLPAVLALDIGTSSCRASLYSAAGAHVRGAAAREQYLVATTPEGGAELDAEQLFQAVCSVIDRVLQARNRRGGVLAVATSAFWHSLLAVDASGAALTPVYLWADARSRGEASQLRAELDEAAIHARTGCMLHWSYWPAKLRWLRETRPEVWRRAARFISFGEYLLLRLFGNCAVSVSTASGTGLLDQHQLAWDGQLLETAGITPSRLSPLGAAGQGWTQWWTQLRPEFARRWPALWGTPWLPAIGDGAASNLGAGCTSPDSVALMIGTSAAERVVWRTDDFTIPPGVFCYRLDAQRIVLGGAMNDGGNLFAWLRRSFHLPDLAKVERELAEMEPDTHGLTVLPFWAGERSPGWADDAQGAIVGLRLHSTPLDVLRAAMEGVALRFGALDQRLKQTLPGEHDVVATGGALLHSPPWMQMIADVLGRPVHASVEPEASSRGAALYALDAVDALHEPLESIRPAVATAYLPDPRRTEVYARAAERQQRLYQQLLGDARGLQSAAMLPAVSPA